MTGWREKVAADVAAEIGLIYKSLGEDDYDAELAMLIDKIGNGPTKALSAMKKVITANTLPRLDEALEAELAGQVSLFSTSDAFEGGMAFLEKRPPEFSGA